MKALAAPAVSIVAALLWLILAWRTPTNTYHFSPLIVAAAWPAVLRSVSGRADGGRAAVAVAGAAAVAVGTGIVLLVSDRLRGPTFWSESGASGQVLIEILLATIIGGLYGLRVLTRERSGLFA